MTGALQNPAASSDVDLIILGQELEFVQQLREDFAASNKDEDPHYDRHWSLRERIEELPAQTSAGLVVKSRAAELALKYDQDAECSCEGSFINLAKSVILSLAAQRDAFVGHSTDPVLTAFDAWQLKRDAYNAALEAFSGRERSLKESGVPGPDWKKDRELSQLRTVLNAAIDQESAALGAVIETTPMTPRGIYAYLELLQSVRDEVDLSDVIDTITHAVKSLLPSPVPPTDYTLCLADAFGAGANAARRIYERQGRQDIGACGSATISLSTSTAFGQWALANKAAVKTTEGNAILVTRMPPEIATQNIDVRQAFAQTIFDSLTAAGIDGLSIHHYVD